MVAVAVLLPVNAAEGKLAAQFVAPAVAAAGGADGDEKDKAAASRAAWAEHAALAMMEAALAPP